MPGTVFRDRKEAALKLAAELQKLRLGPAEIFALPRGGVETGFYLARALRRPLHSLPVKKIPVPGNPELALGAVAAGGEPVWDEDAAAELGAGPEYLQSALAEVRREVRRRQEEYGAAAPDLKGKVAVVTDDGAATGLTLLAAIGRLRQLKPKRVIAAVPVLPRETLRKLQTAADRVVYLLTPPDFYAVGQFYADFPQVSDAEVKSFLSAASE